MHVISLGAGVQSTTLALMAKHGKISPMPDCAIFADTADESQSTYRHLEWLKATLPFPVHTGSRGKLSAALFAGDDQARIPAFVKAGGITNRQCTRNFKIRVIRRITREILGLSKHQRVAPGSVVQWIGISTDEADRMKPAGVAYVTNRWPLIELGISRRGCEAWLIEQGYTIPPKSACVYCAFQSKAQWRWRKINEPAEHAFACQVDANLRTPENVARFRGELYLHPSRRPLAEVDFDDPASPQLEMFSNECEGVCGV